MATIRMQIKIFPLMTMKVPKKGNNNNNNKGIGTHQSILLLKNFKKHTMEWTTLG